MRISSPSGTRPTVAAASLPLCGWPASVHALNFPKESANEQTALSEVQWGGGLGHLGVSVYSVTVGNQHNSDSVLPENYLRNVYSRFQRPIDNRIQCYFEVTACLMRHTTLVAFLEQ